MRPTAQLKYRTCVDYKLRRATRVGRARAAAASGQRQRRSARRRAPRQYGKYRITRQSIQQEAPRVPEISPDSCLLAHGLHMPTPQTCGCARSNVPYGLRGSGGTRAISFL